jgi:Fic family protein
MEAGTLKKQLSGEAAFYSFVPAPLQGLAIADIGLDADFHTLLAETNHALGVLNGVSSQIPDIELFISMYIRKEALLSSQIEGTQATLDDIFDPMLEQNQNLHVEEVINYIKALNFVLSRMRELPLCKRLLRETHAILLSGNRGADKNPGEFRRSQNWIGGAGSTIKTASYIPPSPEDMGLALDDLERFINDDTLTEPLINIALIHYQFETIHPFLDGNGRIGRLLIILYLCAKGLLAKPVLYVSHYLKLNRVEYYDRLSAVRRNGDYGQWARFFVRAIRESALDAIDSIERLLRLREENTAKIATLGRSAKTALKVFAYLEHSPIIEAQKTARELGLSFNTVAKAVENLRSLSILQTSALRRNRRFAYTAYLDILRKDAAPLP